MSGNLNLSNLTTHNFLENILPSTYLIRCLKSQSISTQVSRFSSPQQSRRETPPCLSCPLAGPSLPGSSSGRSCTEAFCPSTLLVLGRGLRRLSSSRRPDRQSVGAGDVRAVDLGMIMVMMVIKNKMMMTICWSSRREGGGPGCEEAMCKEASKRRLPVIIK